MALTTTVLGQPLMRSGPLQTRALLNRRLEQLHRNNGVTMKSNLSSAEAIRAIQALTGTLDPSTDAQVKRDLQLIRKTHWHHASLLSAYLNSESPSYKRDRFKTGVYVLFDLRENQFVPLFVESAPKYVGMSSELHKRLRHHAVGSLHGSTPADHVTQEYLAASTQGEREAYLLGSMQEQQELRRLAMDRRRLWVKTTHTDTRLAAFELEEVMTHFFRKQGVELWGERPIPRRGVDPR